MRKPLTARQREIYDFIVRQVQQHGMPPTIREIGDHFGMRSSNGAREALNSIARKGYIRRHDRKSRGIEIVQPESANNEHSNGIAVPIFKEFPEKMTAETAPAISQFVIVDSSHLPDGFAFAVRVDDDGLTSCGVFPGDIAVAVARKPVSDIALVVAESASQLVVRRYRNSHGGSGLLPCDGDGRAGAVTATEATARVVGEVCTLIRHMGAVTA